MLERVVILDLETSGLEPTKDIVVEVAAILFDVKTATAISSVAHLVKGTRNEAEKVNRIPAAALEFATPAEMAWGDVLRLLRGADAIVAHNGDEFDRLFTPDDVARLVPWIDSKDDLLWPMQDKPGMSLINLALAHGLGVSHAHRALTDCDLISRLLTRVAELGIPLEPFLARGLRPKATFASLLPYEDGNVTNKEHGFQWKPEHKQWRRRMACEDAAALPFATKQVTV